MDSDSSSNAMPAQSVIAPKNGNAPGTDRRVSAGR